MPKLIVNVPNSNEGIPYGLPQKLKELVAEAASVPDVVLTIDDVDVKFDLYGPLSSFSQEVTVEIETFGYPERVAKFTKEFVTELKMKMETLFEKAGFNVDRSKPMLWIKYVDHRGHHV